MIYSKMIIRPGANDPLGEIPEGGVIREQKNFSKPESILNTFYRSLPHTNGVGYEGKQIQF